MLDSELESNAPEWVTRLRNEERLQGRVWHRDFHFGNILADEGGNIHAIIDWEFGGVGVCTSSFQCEAMHNILPIMSLCVALIS